MSDELEKAKEIVKEIWNCNDETFDHPKHKVSANHDANLIAEALRRQTREALEMPEVKALMNLATHTGECENSFEMKCFCGYEKAFENFTKLVEKLK